MGLITSDSGVMQENHGGNLGQMKQFQDLHGLLQLKLQLARSGEGGGMWDYNAMAGQGVVRRPNSLSWVAALASEWQSL